MAGSKKDKIYPHTWISGSDPVRHKQYYVWLQQKNQAQYRDEGWNLDFDIWVSLWGDLWEFRGRSIDSYCMTRKNINEPWTKKNVEVITRGEHFKRQRERRYS